MDADAEFDTPFRGQKSITFGRRRQPFHRTV
jgi:hypothetical protein